MVSFLNIFSVDSLTIFLVKLAKSNIAEDVFLQGVIPKAKKSVQDQFIGHQSLSLNRPVLEHHRRDQFYQKQKPIMMTHHMNATVEYQAVIATMCKFSISHMSHMIWLIDYDS